MANAKTKPTEQSVADCIAAVEPEARREDARMLDVLEEKIADNWDTVVLS